MNEKKKNHITVQTVLKALDKIEAIRRMGGVFQLDHAVTVAQKDILQAFYITEATVKYSWECWNLLPYAL